MITYFNNQVLGSIQNVKIVNSRFEIVGIFLENIAISLALGVIIIIFSIKNKINKSIFKENLRWALVFVFVTLAGVFPIMISMKQRSFYILTVYPLFSIGLAYYLYPFVKPAIDKFEIKEVKFYAKLFKIVVISVIVISLVLSFLQINRVGRDNDMIYDTKAVIEEVGRNQTINICSSMYSIWALHGYFSRYGNVSLDYNKKNLYKYYLALNSCNSEYLKENYDLVPINLKTYKLYKLKY